MFLNKKIFIIESDLVTREFFETIFLRGGYSVSTAESESEAVIKIKDFLPDVLILDADTVKVDSFWFSQRNEPPFNVPVIISSNVGSSSDLSLVSSIGAESYFIKSHFEPEDVIKKVRDVLDDRVQDKEEDDSQEELLRKEEARKEQEFLRLEENRRREEQERALEEQKRKEEELLLRQKEEDEQRERERVNLENQRREQEQNKIILAEEESVAVDQEVEDILSESLREIAPVVRKRINISPVVLNVGIVILVTLNIVIISLILNIFIKNTEDLVVKKDEEVKEEIVEVDYTEEVYFPEEEVVSVDGGWGQWSQWSSCVITPATRLSCGYTIEKGEKTRERVCDNPAPEGDGSSCSGEDKEKDACTANYFHGNCPTGHSCTANSCVKNVVAEPVTFCTREEHKNSSSLVDGNTVYCDSNLNLWTPTFELPAETENINQYEWGCHGTIVGASSLNDSAFNTRTITGSSCSDENSAASFCENLSYGGSSNWQLPAINILRGLYADCIRDGSKNYGDPCNPVWDKNAVSGYYWSSTESSAKEAKRINFFSSLIFDYDKSFPYYHLRCTTKK